jgi:hypothetical protein
MWSWEPLVQNEYVLFCFLCFVIGPREKLHPDPKRLPVVPNTTSNKLKPQVARKPVKQKSKSGGSLRSGLTPQSSKTIFENPQQATPDNNTYINMTTNDQAYVQPDPKVDPSDEYMFDGDRDDAGRYFCIFI